jgi:hypothetical protein
MNSGRQFRIIIQEIDPIKDTTISTISNGILTGNDRDRIVTSLGRLFDELLDEIVPAEE